MRFLLLALPFALWAADEVVQDGNWSHRYRLSLYAGMTSGSNTDASRDPSINGTDDTVNYRAGFSGQLRWQEAPNSVEQTLDLAYGQQKNRGEATQEKVDEIRYDGTYERAHSPTSFWYGGWAAETAFSGPEPDEDILDPLIARASGGYGQRHENIWLEQSVLLWRAGVRAERRWGASTTEAERTWATGPEARVRYEQQRSEDLSWWAQYDVFTEFDDLGHLNHLLTAQLDVHLTRLLTLTITARGYYEHKPDDAEADTGYNELSWRSETLLGLVYTF